MHAMHAVTPQPAEMDRTVGTDVSPALARLPARAGAVWVVAALAVPRLLGAVITVVLRRHLGPAASGLFDLAFTPYKLLDTFRSFGTGPALVFEKDMTSALADTAWTLNMIAAVAIALLLQLLAAPAAHYYGHPAIEQIVRVLSIAYIFASVASVHYFLLLRDLNFRARAIPPLGQVLAAGVLAVLFALWGFGVGALVAREVASAVVGALLLWVIHPFRPRLRLVTPLARRLLGYGAWIGAGLALLYLSQNVDLFVGGRIIHRARDVGFYSTSWTLAFMMAGILSVLSGNVVFPTLTRVRDDAEALQRKLLAGFQQASLIMMPAAFLLACLAPVLIVPVLGGRFSQYRGMFVVLSLLAVYAGIRTLLAVFFEGYKAVGKPWLVPAYNGVKLLVLIPCMIYGAHYGVVGLALGYVPVTLLEIPVALLLVFAVLGVTPRDLWLSTRAPFTATALMAAAALGTEAAVTSLAGGADLVALISACITATLTYVGSLYILDRSILREARVVLIAGL